MQQQTVHLAKIKKAQFIQKILLDPSHFRTGIPKKSLPELTDQGLILSQKTISSTPHPKINQQGALKITIKYQANILIILNRYIQVKVIDQYDNAWLGIFFGYNVKGKGNLFSQQIKKDKKNKKSNKIVGCKVVKIQGQTIYVEKIDDGGLSAWTKIQKKAKEILQKEVV